jgi:peptide-methionine (S)-S-oxide reductase
VLEQQHYHQQYLSDSKNPNGYCGTGGVSLSCPVGAAKA